MKHPETYDLFPTLVQKYNIFNDSDIVEDIFSNDDLGNHSLLIESKMKSAVAIGALAALGLVAVTYNNEQPS